jgi:LytS/YehU family sensor histidine kinase
MLIILNEQYHHIVEHELVESEEELTKNKVQLLAKQISPHYIYNSLQSIREFCESDPAKARDVLDYFSEFLRGNLESLTVEEMVPFERELELTKAYLELEKITGREQFEVEYQLETTDFMLPPLVLQPVVENAVKYGTMCTAACMDPGESGVTEIIIATRKAGGSICIEVTDKTKGGGSAAADAYLQAGAPETPGSRGKKKSVGLENVRTRLAIQSGGTLDIESTDRGTKVTVLLRMMPVAAATQKK